MERGRELRTDYALIARALARKANALVKQEKLEEAVAVYNKSLMEHRTADTLKRLNETEKKLKVCAQVMTVACGCYTTLHRRERSNNVLTGVVWNHHTCLDGVFPNHTCLGIASGLGSYTVVAMPTPADMMLRYC